MVPWIQGEGGWPFFDRTLSFSFTGSWGCFCLIRGTTLKPLSDVIQKLILRQWLRTERRNRREGLPLASPNQEESVRSTVAESRRGARPGGRGEWRPQTQTQSQCSEVGWLRRKHRTQEDSVWEGREATWKLHLWGLQTTWQELGVRS